MTEKSRMKKVGTIKNNALGYDVGFDINYFLPDGTDMYIELPRERTFGSEVVDQEDEWVWCKDKLPDLRDADEWGNIFFLLMEEEDEQPELVNIHDFLNTLSGKDLSTLRPNLCFWWKRTGLTPPEDRGERKKTLGDS